MYPRVGEKRSIDDINIEDEEAIGSLCRLSGRAVSPKSVMENEKRIRREIANSNERRRMQSINAGFASLKSLLPHHEGEKLSKAAILQQTAEYIYQLEQDKTRLLAQNCQLKRLLNQHHHSDNEGSPSGSDSPNEDRSQLTTSPALATPLPLSAEIEEIKNNFTSSLHEKDRLISRLKPDVAPQEESKEQGKMDYQNTNEIKLELQDSHFEEDLTKTDPRTLTNETPMDTVEIVDASELRLTKQVTKVTDLSQSNGQSARIPISVLASSETPAANIIGSTAFRTLTEKTSSSGTVIASPTTILTVLPQNKTKTLTPVLDLRSLGDVETEGGNGTATATVEYVSDADGLRNHTVYIVDSNNSSCQKNLDTICEAIRHLEGDHLFSSEEMIKEEVVTTDEPFVESFIRKGTQCTLKQPLSSPILSQEFDDSQTRVSQPHLEHLTLHMLPPEPQEVPLELTTTHRSSNSHSNSSENCNSSRDSQYAVQESAVISRPPPSIRQPSRPGVIVVKNP